jgi:hypothetical protein
VHDLPDLRVDSHALDINVRETEHSQSGGVVAAPGLESDEAIGSSVRRVNWPLGKETNRDSTMSTLPTPLRPAMSLRALKSSSEPVTVSPPSTSSLTGIPSSKVTENLVGTSGASRGSEYHRDQFYCTTL